MSEGTRQPHDSSFCRDIDGLVHGGNHPTDRAHVDDGASLSLLHRWKNRLSQEKLMLEIDGDCFVPKFRRNLGNLVPLVVPGVIYEYIDYPDQSKNVLHSALQRRN